MKISVVDVMKKDIERAEKNKEQYEKDGLEFMEPYMQGCIDTLVRYVKFIEEENE